MSDNMNKEFLVFKLGQEEYGVDIQKVQEIRNYEQPTVVANQAPFMKGVVNLRGSIVPILDLRIKLNLPYSYNDFTVSIILNIDNKTTGIVVDSVCDVVMLEPEQVQTIENVKDITQSGYLVGLATLENRMIQIINIEKFMLDPHNFNL